MIFDKRSNQMLKYEKSKAKLVEFDVAKEDYPDYPLNSDDLTYTTIFALSRFCEECIENPSSPHLSELKSELAIVSQYFDSTVKTQLRQDHDKLFLLLGATAYFLLENFGSAKVLIEQLEIPEPKDNIVTFLYTTLRFLLTGKWTEIPTKGRYSHQYLNSLKNHFEKGDSADAILDELRKIREAVYQSANVFAVNYIDFLYAVAICAINHSAWTLLPQYSNASLKKWGDYLSRRDSIKLLWPAQKVILQAGALTGKDIIVPLPTGVGKTKSIEVLLRSKFFEQETCITIIIAPLRALCNEITAGLTSALAGEAIVNQFTDTTQEDFNLELISNTKYVFVCTPEKFTYILRHEPDFLTSIQLFIFDEAHLFDDVSRGAQYELLVSEIARSRNESAQMVLFSAVLSNASQISEWIFSDKNATIDYSLVKSTEKSIGFLSSNQTIHYYEKDDMADESFFVPKSIAFTQLQLRGKERNPKIFPKMGSQDTAIYYANKLCPQGGAAIYAGQVKSIPPIMRRIVEIGDRGYDISNLLVNGEADEVDRLSNLFAAHYGEAFELTGAARLGAFPHYADLPNGMKMAIEYALRQKQISFVVCTTTLAEGVNIPIKYLFLTTFSLGTTSVQIRKMQNMVGRTARSGIHTEGSAIITDSNFHDKRFDRRSGGNYRWADCKKMFDYGHAEACSSAILSLVSDLKLDYAWLYTSSALSAFLIENYNTPSYFQALTGIIQASYKEHLTDDENDVRYNRYADEIAFRVSELEHVIASVENYLCYIYHSQQSNEHFIDITDVLVTQTFAYFLGNDDQKRSLVTIFRLIAKKIIADIKPENAGYYAKSLYGIDVSSKILNWVNENFEILEDCQDKQLLDATATIFVKLFPERVKDVDTLTDVLRLWVEGLPYVDIFNELQGKVTINQIEKLCSNTLSYHFSSLLGNVLDAVEDRAKNLTEQLTLLQKMVKYGVPSRVQVLVCEGLFDDRVLAKQLEEMIGLTDMNDRAFRDYIHTNKQRILESLKAYPAYFSYKLRLYTRKKAE